jgi:uncharacterized protein YndB with AHSA1/START domain
MTFDPGPLAEVTVDDGTLVFVRELRQAPASVWAALTDPAELNRWAPFTATADLGRLGDTTLTLVDGPARTDLPATVLRAEPPVLLEYTWGDDLLRWELEPSGDGTRLTLRHTPTKPDMDAMDYGWASLRDAYAARLGEEGQ